MWWRSSLSPFLGSWWWRSVRKLHRYLCVWYSFLPLFFILFLVTFSLIPIEDEKKMMEKKLLIRWNEKKDRERNVKRRKGGETLHQSMQSLVSGEFLCPWWMDPSGRLRKGENQSRFLSLFLPSYPPDCIPENVAWWSLVDFLSLPSSFYVAPISTTSRKSSCGGRMSQMPQISVSFAQSVIPLYF